MAVIAIDGPAGSGKSTVARALARRLGVPHVDTGAYYRAATLAALEAGVDMDDEQQLCVLVTRLNIQRPAGRTLLAGNDVEQQIRTAGVDDAVSKVAAHPAVRAVLIERQQAAVPASGAVVEGRDAGTRVVPSADLKIWLTASPVVRARRRAQDKAVTAARHNDAGRAPQIDPQVVQQQINALSERDRRDRANMGRANDVLEVDTTDMSVDEVVEHIVSMLKGTS